MATGYPDYLQFPGSEIAGFGIERDDDNFSLAAGASQSFSQPAVPADEEHFVQEIEISAEENIGINKVAIALNSDGIFRWISHFSLNKSYKSIGFRVPPGDSFKVHVQNFANETVFFSYTVKWITRKLN